jgi:tetratricopeptide (TPR) repeat protein
MAYPGNPELSTEAQDKVMTAFGQVISKIQANQRDEAMIGLDFVLRLDPTFAPGINLRQQLTSGAAEIDLAGIISQLNATSADDINDMMLDAIDQFNNRDFVKAKQIVTQVLGELPGHQEARQLMSQVDEAIKVQQQVGSLVSQAREALVGGDAQEASNFVMMAQALDPHNESIQAALDQIQAVSGQTAAPAAGAATGSAPAGEGFELDTGPSQPAAPPGLSLEPEVPDNVGFGFEEQVPAGDGGLGFEPQAPADDGGFGFEPETPAADSGGFGFEPEAPAADSGGFDFEPEAPADSSGFGFEPEAPADSGGFGFEPEAPADSGGFGFEPEAPADSGGFGFEPEAPAADSGGFGFEPEAPAADSGGFGFEPEASAADSGSFGFEPEAPAGGGGLGVGADEPSGDSGFGFESAAADQDLWGGSTTGDTGLGTDLGGGDLFSTDDDTDLFGGADAADAFEAIPTAAPAAGGGDSDRIRQLIDQGESAFNRGSLDEAIASWSQIYLIDPTHGEAARLIEETRLAKDELDQQLAAKLVEARAAAESGDKQKAVRLADEILGRHLSHIGATELKEAIASGGGVASQPAEAPPSELPEGPALPDLAEDLFQEDLPDVENLGELEPAPEPGKRKPVQAADRKALPLPWILLGVGGLVIILVGVWFGRQLLSSGPDRTESIEVLNQALANAEQKAQQNQLNEAIQMLQLQLQNPSYDQTQRTRVEQKIAQYEAMLHPTPTPIPVALTNAERLITEGLLLDAYRTVMEGLESNSRDVGLLELKDQIHREEPLVGNLYRAMKAGNHRTVISIAQELLDRFPGRSDLMTELDRGLFNASLDELKSYNLTGAEVHLVNLANRHPDDREVQRILEFIATYKARPVDMRLKVFIGNLSPR